MNRDLRRTIGAAIRRTDSRRNAEILEDTYYKSLLADARVDFDAYCQTHQQLDRDYRYPAVWWSKAIANIAAAGVFSSDRTIAEYNEQIWHLPKYENGRARLFKSG